MRHDEKSHIYVMVNSKDKEKKKRCQPRNLISSRNTPLKTGQNKDMSRMKLTEN